MLNSPLLAIRDSLVQTPLFARQPIFDKKSNIYGFEFLYRGNLINAGNEDSAKLASLELLEHMCTCIIDGELNSDKFILINVDEHFIFDDNIFTTPPQNVIFEILETVNVTPELVKRVDELKSKGFTFALDDYIFERLCFY